MLFLVKNILDISKPLFVHFNCIDIVLGFHKVQKSTIAKPKLCLDCAMFIKIPRSESYNKTFGQIFHLIYFFFLVSRHIEHTEVVFRTLWNRVFSKNRSAKLVSIKSFVAMFFQCMNKTQPKAIDNRSRT